MMKRKFFYLPSLDGRSHQSLSADDLMAFGFSNSSAYRAIKTGVLPPHRVRDLQFKIFGDLPGWKGWKIFPGKIVSPAGKEYTPHDLDNLSYLETLLASWDI